MAAFTKAVLCISNPQVVQTGLLVRHALEQDELQRGSAMAKLA